VQLVLLIKTAKGIFKL